MKYELAAVLDGKSSSAKKKSALEKLEKLISIMGGKVLSVDDWGVKELAYTIQKSDTGIFLILQLELDTKAAAAIQNKLRLEDYLIRYLFIKKDGKES